MSNVTSIDYKNYGYDLSWQGFSLLLTDAIKCYLGEAHMANSSHWTPANSQQRTEVLNLETLEELNFTKRQCFANFEENTSLAKPSE